MACIKTENSLTVDLITLVSNILDETFFLNAKNKTLKAVQNVYKRHTIDGRKT